MLQKANVVSFKNADVEEKIKGLGIDAARKSRMVELADSLQKKLKDAKGDINKKAVQSRIEGLLVEWGVSMQAFGKVKNADYQYMAKLLAAACVSAE